MTASPRALLLDYVGVLTSDVARSSALFEAAVGIPPGRCFELLLEDTKCQPDGGVLAAFERGEVDASVFERRLRDLLTADGVAPPPGELLPQLFASVRPQGQLWDVAAQARAAGVITALVSNSWGMEIYDFGRIDAHFDVQLISGEVGVRKPDPAIFELAAQQVGVGPQGCVFVDDRQRNVDAARGVGMEAVLHEGDDHTTAARVAALLDIEVVLARP